MKIYMMKGLPASGKDTLAQKMIEESKGNLKRVNKDYLREMIDGSKWSKKREKLILSTERSLAESFLISGYDIIITDTNLHPKHEDYFKDLAEKYNADFEIIDLTDVPVTECIKRDARRDNSVGSEVILRMYYSFIFDQKRITQGFEKERPEIILCDLDGTLAIHDGRNPFDQSRYEEDLFNWKLWEIIKDKRVIFLSGREGTRIGREKTKKWISYHTKLSESYVEDNLFMRKEKDYRKDNVVKKELFENKIEPYFNIIAVFDDRQQVVDMWRAKGLICFQVNYGDF